MTIEQVISNLKRAKCVPYKKETLEMAIKALKQEPKTGHWIKNEGSLYCSFCGCGALYDKVYTGESVFGKTIRVDSTFCPTCGAKMTAESEETV